MDLSFPSPTPAARAALSAADAWSLAASLGPWMAAGETARVQATLDIATGPADIGPQTLAAGAFNPAMAARLRDWGQS